MLETLSDNKFEYTKLTPEEQKERGILGILYGPIADTKQPTRNGRLYPKEAWEKAINDPIFQEQLKNHAILGELEHPTDRDAIDPTKACMCLADTPKVGKDGLLYGQFHILDLPNGRILKTLCDYGTKIGVSSRGNGDIVEDYDGNSSVEPSTFDLTCWDAVILPAVEKARMNYVTESLDQDNQKQLRKALKESLSKSSDEEKKIMKDTLKSLGISLTTPKKKINEDINTQKSDNIDKSSNSLVENKSLAVEDNEAKQLVIQLKEALKSKVDVERQLQRLQEQLAVSDTKVKKLEDENSKLKKSTINLSKQVRESKDLNEENLKLKEQLQTKDNMIKVLSNKVTKLNESIETNSQSTKSLQESISTNKNDLLKLRENLLLEKKSHKDEVSSLNEKLEKTKKEYDSKLNESNVKLTKVTKLVEKYKSFVNTTVDRYIESKAIMLGVTPNEIKNRLSESYTLDDVDKVCEDLQQYNLRMSRLPFNVSKGTRVSINETKKPQIQKSNDDDDVSGLVNMMDRF